MTNGVAERDYETTVDVVEPMGSENQVYLLFDANENTHETFVASVSGMHRVEAGQPAVARIPEEVIHLFDIDSGEALRNRQLETTEAVEQRL